MYLRIPTPQEVSAAYCNLQEAAERLGYPVAVKAMGDGWRLRADLAAVRLDLTGPEAVAERLTSAGGRFCVEHDVPRRSPGA